MQFNSFTYQILIITGSMPFVWCKKYQRNRLILNETVLKIVKFTHFCLDIWKSNYKCCKILIYRFQPFLPNVARELRFITISSITTSPSLPIWKMCRRQQRQHRSAFNYQISSEIRRRGHRLI